MVLIHLGRVKEDEDVSVVQLWQLASTNYEFGNGLTNKGGSQMKYLGMGKLQYLLYALLTVVLAGCGANQAGVIGSGNAQGAVAAKLVYQAGKVAGKSVALPASGTIVATVTGTARTGSPRHCYAGVIGIGGL